MATPYEITSPRAAAAELGRARRYHPSADHSALVERLAAARIAHQVTKTLDSYGLAGLSPAGVAAVAALMAAEGEA